MKNLENKVAIITGGSRGIGRATALRMAEQGAKVVISARDVKRLDAVVGMITSAGGSAIAVPCNLDKEDEIEKVVQTAVEKFGTVDILANVGQGSTKGAGAALENLKSSAAVFSFYTGAIASMLFMQMCFPYMKKKGGSIINVSSRYSDIGGSGYLASPYEDIAPIIAFLASDQACYLNGEVIGVDGGLSKCSSTN